MGFGKASGFSRAHSAAAVGTVAAAVTVYHLQLGAIVVEYRERPRSLAGGDIRVDQGDGFTSQRRGRKWRLCDHRLGLVREDTAHLDALIEPRPFAALVKLPRSCGAV